MSKLEQVLQIEPKHELFFKGPFNTASTCYMKLTNPSNQRVLYKIKTTAPKKYCVRPNCGILEPSKTVEVAVILQPFSYDPSEKYKHKFMIQTMIAPDEGDINLEQIWREVNPNQLMDTKLKCNFEVDEASVNTIIEQNQFSPASASTPLIDNTSIDKSNVSVLKRMREVENYLKQENQRLKEEVLIMRNQMGLAVMAPNSENALQESVSMFYVSLAVILCIIGFLFGKYAF